MQRRIFLSCMAGTALAATRIGHASATPSVLSAWAEDIAGERRYFAGAIDTAVPALALAARAHAVIAHPQRSDSAYVCARRPGSYLIHFDPQTARTRAATQVDEAIYRFEGHVLIDAVRDRVLVTESEIDQGQGRIGLYDGVSLQRLGSWPTHGIGPHELLWLERDVLVVANGGILTLPETGRVKRNIDRMAPSLVLVDARDGSRLAAFVLADHKLSIRHLARADDGTLAVALQNEGAAAAPLLALLRNGTFQAVPTSPTLAQHIGGYAAAVATWGDRFAVTCTRADRVVVWDTRGRYCGELTVRKPSGIVRLGNDWLVSNEFGELVRIDAEQLRVRVQRQVRGRLWDNHLAAMSV
ncbi:MAG: DUF1513 domain-containing protein [Gammaproteobacteria bacterium]|nr:DUF1513 domain-containing protein [Gammaproteobacteria bacterium]